MGDLMMRSKVKVLWINPGPSLSVKVEKYEALSELVNGDVITSSANEKIISKKNISSIRFHCTKYNYRHKTLSSLSLMLYCLFFAIRNRIAGNKYSLVVTYDPLKTGLIGLICAKILRSKFSPEVNGVYTSKKDYLDFKSANSGKLFRYIYPIIERFVLSRADGIKLLFPEQLKLFEKSISNKVIRAFPNYVNISSFLLKANSIEKNEILFVGFPFFLKGVDILIDAFKKISSKYSSWQLKILGWYPDKTILNQYIGGHPRIIYHPPVFHDEIPDHICSCSIFVLPSRTEAMGRVLVEAMAAGKARIGSNVDGIPTVIRHGVDGLLFNVEDVDDLAEKMSFLIENPTVRKNLGSEALKRVVEEFTTKNYVKSVTQFYEDVVNKNGIINFDNNKNKLYCS
jgi:glycosyltransferase involved in cell wall biosynthesis